MDELQAQIQLLTNRVNNLEARNFNQNFSNTIIQNKETVVQRGGVQSAEFVTGASGWRFDADGNLEANAGFFRGDITGASGTFSGNISGGSVDIGGADSTSFHVDTSGNMWLGASAFNINTNPFAVSSAGAMRATSGVLGPWTLSSSAISTGAFDTLNTLYFGTSGLSLSNVFKVTAAGAMTALSGLIGPWDISSTALSTGTFDTLNTMYFGNSGISLSDKFKVTSAGVLTATAGTIGGFTINATKLYGGTFQTAATVGGGNSGVILDSAGLRGYDAVLGTTFNLPTNGDAPTFSSGIISETIFEINTNAVLRTSSTVGDGSSSSEGVLINETGIYGVGPDQLLADANVRILSNGDAYFSGVFNLGGTQITIGSDEDIQTALNEVYAAGGGTVFLDIGTYVLTGNVDVPSGVRLEGVSRDGVIIDCDGSFGVRIVGDSVYSTGTVTIANGATTVTGSGTVWTSGMVGQFILLDGLWYEILARISNTNITITEYQGDDLAGSSYVLANPNFNATISKITVINATSAGVAVQYSMEPNLFDMVIYDNGTGIDMDYVVFPRLVVTSAENGVNLNMNFVEGFYIDYSEFNFSTVGAGVVMTNSKNATFFNSSVNDNTGDGITATSCDKIAFISFDISGNGGQGVEFVSGCDDNQFTDGVFDGNASDNIKFTATSDRNTLVAISCKNAGGYGINIATSASDNNQIIAPAFEGNTSGNINDLGTDTLIVSSEQPGNAVYGSGIDGAVVFDGSTTILGMVPVANVYTMTRDIYCTNITVNNGVSIATAGFRIFASGTLTNNGTIRCNGANASGTTAGNGYDSQSTPGSTDGGGGFGSGTTTAAGNSGQAFFAGYAPLGGLGGNGGNANGGAGGTRGTYTLNRFQSLPEALSLWYISGTGDANASTIGLRGAGGGSGGGSGGRTTGGTATTPGAGGAGAGTMVIVAKVLDNTSGSITAIGGNGGNAAGGTCATGGGGGGGGGFIVLIYNTLISIGTTSVAGGTAGTSINGAAAAQNGGVGMITQIPNS